MIAAWLAAALLLVLQAAPAAPDPRRPAPVLDSVPPDVPGLAHPAVLIVSKTNGYRHDSIAEAVPAIEGLAKARGWSSFATENAAVFNPRDLAKFDVIVFANASGDIYTPDQRTAFQAFLARLDEATLRLEPQYRMGRHALIWWRCEGRARIFYSALGHQAEAWSDPAHLTMLDGAVGWAARKEGEGCD